MLRLNVPYAEKDQARELGARWNAEKKFWYVPDGMLATPFECWLVDGSPGSAWRPEIDGKLAGRATKPAKKSSKPKGRVRRPSQRVDSFGGKVIVGANYKEAIGAVGLPWAA